MKAQHRPPMNSAASAAWLLAFLLDPAAQPQVAQAHQEEVGEEEHEEIIV